MGPLACWIKIKIGCNDLIIYPDRHRSSAVGTIGVAETQFGSSRFQQADAPLHKAVVDIVVIDITLTTESRMFCLHNTAKNNGFLCLQTDSHSCRAGSAGCGIFC